MAIARGAGTEIIRAHHFEDVGSPHQKLIFGTQHHIYTVLSVVMYCAVRTGTEYGYLTLVAYDSDAGTTAQPINLARVGCETDETYIWGDKFSFNGHEPVDFSGPMDDVTKQDAIADQGSSVVNYLKFATDSANTKYDITVTFIDQNNS